MDIHAKKKLVRQTVTDSIRILFEEAEKNSIRHSDRTKRYMRMIWNLVKKHNIRLTKEQKKRFCRKCSAFFILDKNAIVIFNTRNNGLYLSCNSCGYQRRI